MIRHMGWCEQVAVEGEKFPDGSWCPLGKTDNFGENTPNDRAAGKSVMILYDTHHGLCIRDRELNGYSDSDFFMLVWGPLVKEAYEIEYATTRGWCYPCFASNVDATPEVLAEYEAWKARQAAAREVQRRHQQAVELIELRKKLRAASANTGLSVGKLLRLRAATGSTFPQILKLLTANLRSKFKLSMREQVVKWANDPAPKYGTPLSVKQVGYLQPVNQRRW